jgi:two-component system phosphate regulon response regulator PhoB
MKPGGRGSAEVSALAAGGRARFVILVDDDEAIAEMYRLGLEHAGFRVRVLGDAHALFRALAEEVPDILVLDWQLPGMSGAEALELLRRDVRGATLPVFMLSNYLGDQNGGVDRVFAAGALAWLRKPVTPPSVLAERLTEALAGRRRNIA